MRFHLIRKEKRCEARRKPTFLVLKRRWLMLGAAVIAAAGVFAAANAPAAVSASAATRQLPIYCVQRTQKMCAISFDAAWGADRMRQKRIARRLSSQPPRFFCAAHQGESSSAPRSVSEKR